MTQREDDGSAAEVDSVNHPFETLKRRAKTGQLGSHLTQREAHELLAAVDALREQLKAYETLFNLAAKRELPWIEAWRKATGRSGTLPDYGKLLAWIITSAPGGKGSLVKSPWVWGA